MGKRGILALALVLALVGAACGGDDDDGGGNDPTEELTGDLFISGSSTVEPITGLVAELFNETEPGVAINVEGPGTGDGFELFCNGETDISDASRPIDEEDEVPVCEESGIEYIELEVAIDGMAVMTHPENTAISSSGTPRSAAMSSNTSSTKESYVPDSSPGATMVSSASGYGAFGASSSVARALASDQFEKPSDSGPIRA